MTTPTSATTARRGRHRSSHRSSIPRAAEKRERYMLRRRIGRSVGAGALVLALAGIGAACTGVKGGPPGSGVLVVGDSVALELSHPWLQNEITARGREFRSLGAGACAPLEGQTTLDDPPAYTPSPWSCEGVPAGQLQVVNEYRPRT